MSAADDPISDADTRAEGPARPRFIADEMLGRLAKWLRLLGYDTKYISGIADSELLDIAESEGRIVLTRDTRLILRKRCRNHIFIRDDHWREQLRQMYTTANLDLEKILTICAVCNEPLRPVDKEAIETLVPPYVYGAQESFARCGRCSRVFWAATHAEKILGELRRLSEEPQYES